MRNNLIHGLMLVLPRSRRADSVTVPAEVPDTVSPTGKPTVGTFTHVGAAQERYVTRLDLIGIDGKIATYSVAIP